MRATTTPALFSRHRRVAAGTAVAPNAQGQLPRRPAAQEATEEPLAQSQKDPHEPAEAPRDGGAARAADPEDGGGQQDRGDRGGGAHARPPARPGQRGGDQRRGERGQQQPRRQ